MKQFSLEEYLKDPSREIITRDGRKVRRILCTDARGEYPVIALVEDHEGTKDKALSFTKDGNYFVNDFNEKDLFFAPEKKEGWVNILKGTYGVRYIEHTRIFKSKEDAEKAIEYYSDYITTLKIEWEE